MTCILRKIFVVVGHHVKFYYEKRRTMKTEYEEEETEYGRKNSVFSE
jgi:hypothetical protein